MLTKKLNIAFSFSTFLALVLLSFVRTDRGKYYLLIKLSLFVEKISQGNVSHVHKRLDHNNSI